MDKLLDTFEHRMEFELSLNTTQTAHARQILSDLMDTLEPQQPDKRLEQKVRGLLDRLGEGVFQGKIYLNLREDVVQAILTAMCQYQQPAIDLSTKLAAQQPRGGLADCPTKSCNGNRECKQGCEGCDALAYAQAQLAHDKARMVTFTWLNEPCPHSIDPLFLTTRRECDKCMED